VLADQALIDGADFLQAGVVDSSIWKKIGRMPPERIRPIRLSLEAV
jgi:hypothetical protein